MFIVSLTYVADLADIDKHIDAHIQFLEKYYSAETFLMSGRKVPRTGGIILVNATSKEQVESIIKEDPFYIEGVAHYEIVEFVPTMAAQEFRALV